jgi:hypothetical protein
MFQSGSYFPGQRCVLQNVYKKNTLLGLRKVLEWIEAKNAKSGRGENNFFCFWIVWFLLFG